MSRRKTSFSHILKGFRWLPEREGPHTLTPIYGAHSIYMGGHLSPFPGLPPSPFRPVGKNWAFISGRKKSHKVFLRRPRHIFPHCLMGTTNASGCHISWESNLSRPKRTLRVGWANPRAVSCAKIETHYRAEEGWRGGRGRRRFQGGARTDINLCCVRERRRKRAGEKTPLHIFCPEVLEPEEEEERKMGKGEKSMKY